MKLLRSMGAGEKINSRRHITVPKKITKTDYALCVRSEKFDEGIKGLHDPLISAEAVKAAHEFPTLKCMYLDSLTSAKPYVHMHSLMTTLIH